MHTSLSLTRYWCSVSRHVSGITCPSLGGTTRTQNWWLLCAEMDSRFMSYYMYTICFVRLHWVGCEWIRKCSRFLYVPVVDVSWSQDAGRLLREGKGASICWAVLPDAAWCACHKSADTLGCGLRITAVEWAVCGGDRIGCIVVRTGLVVRFCWRVLVMSWCRGYVRIHVCCLVCVGRILIWFIAFLCIWCAPGIVVSSFFPSVRCMTCDRCCRWVCKCRFFRALGLRCHTWVL
jgi:hypothetical protein